MRPAAIPTNTQGQDVGMFDEQEQIANPACLPLLDQLSLQRQSVRIGHPSETPDLDLRPGPDPSARVHASRGT